MLIALVVPLPARTAVAAEKHWDPRVDRSASTGASSTCMDSCPLHDRCRGTHRNRNMFGTRITGMGA